MNTAWFQTLMAGPSQTTAKSIANSGTGSTSGQTATQARSGSNTINAASYGIQPQVVACIQNASTSTGMDFSYLMAQAARESSFDPNAKASTSSAHGLYQFVEQTWLSVFKDHGADYGYGDLASKISTDADGHMVVKDANLKKQILGLRKDPQLSAEMAAEHASDNQAKMEKKLGRPVTGTDLYLAHFLGVQGATKFLRNMQSDPNASAADLFPAAADANNRVFYRDDGSAKSLAQVYQTFGKKISADMAAFKKFENTTGKDAVMQAQNVNNGLTPARNNLGLGNATLMGDTLVTARPSTQIAQSFQRSTDTMRSQLISDQVAFGRTNPGGILSPIMLMTLAGQPATGDDESGATTQSATGQNQARTTIRPQLDQLSLGTFIG